MWPSLAFFNRPRYINALSKLNIFGTLSVRNLFHQENIRYQFAIWCPFWSVFPPRRSVFRSRFHFRRNLHSGILSDISHPLNFRVAFFRNNKRHALKCVFNGTAFLFFFKRFALLTFDWLVCKNFRKPGRGSKSFFLFGNLLLLHFGQISIFN